MTLLCFSSNDDASADGSGSGTSFSVTVNSVVPKHAAIGHPNVVYWVIALMVLVNGWMIWWLLRRQRYQSAVIQAAQGVTEAGTGAAALASAGVHTVSSLPVCS